MSKFGPESQIGFRFADQPRVFVLVSDRIAELGLEDEPKPRQREVVARWLADHPAQTSRALLSNLRRHDLLNDAEAA